MVYAGSGNVIVEIGLENFVFTFENGGKSRAIRLNIVETEGKWRVQGQA